MHRGWLRHPKIAELLAFPEASGAVAEIRLARDLGVGVSTLRGRRAETRYLREDPVNHELVTGALAPRQFTASDRSLFLALQMYEATLCPGCGQPKDRAWHSSTQHAWESEEAVCHVCTLQRGQEIAYSRVTSTLSAQAERELPPFEWGETTTPSSTPSERHHQPNEERGLS